MNSSGLNAHVNPIRPLHNQVCHDQVDIFVALKPYIFFSFLGGKETDSAK